MTGETTEAGSSEFEQRARALLVQSADDLPASVRSRLTQGRYAALAAHPRRRPSFARRWLPVGAAVAAALALLIVYVPGGRAPLENAVATGGLEDIELLSDNDALPLNGDQDVDYDFYEWAANEAATGAAPAVGS
jgi:ferric-dicitrate binding protein FerR (iron transport regulator)